jgi:hypothetical protein
MNANVQRHHACQLAHVDTKRALAAARAIEDPWYACQALAWVARYGPEVQFNKTIGESLRVCSKETDPYRIVASAAWPVRAIVERDQSTMLRSIIPDLLRRAPDIELLASRSEALFLLFQAVFPAGRAHWLPVLQSLRAASSPLINWRQGRNLCYAVLIVGGEDERLAREVIDGLDDAKTKKKIEKLLAAGQPIAPRPFFWIKDAT